MNGKRRGKGYMVPKKKKMKKWNIREAVNAYLFIAPFLIGISIFYIYAFIQNIYISLTNKKSFGVPRFIGLANYEKLFQDAEFYESVLHTVLYVLICVPLVILLAIVIAVALNCKIKGKGLYRTLIYLPIITLPTAIGMLWKWLFNAQFGVINAILNGLGIKGNPEWLSDPDLSLSAMCIVLVWASVGQAVIIFLAGLQGIPGSYYEAARIDGAGGVQCFFKITLPLLSPITFLMVTTEVIGFFQVFDLIFLMITPTSSGMSGARSIVMLYYEEAFKKFNKGYGAAISFILFLIILVITIIQMKMQKKWVHYES